MLERKGELDVNGVAVPLRSPGTRRHGKQCPTILPTPHAGAPGESVHHGIHGRPAPTVRHWWRKPSRDRCEMPAAFPWIAEQLCCERTAVCFGQRDRKWMQWNDAVAQMRTDLRRMASANSAELDRLAKDHAKHIRDMLSMRHDMMKDMKM